MGPLGLIRAMLEPCESKGQALLTGVCMLIVAGGAFAGAFALFMFAEATRLTIAEAASRGTSYGPRMGLHETMFLGYSGALLAGLLTLLLLISAIVIPVRSLFPADGDGAS